MADIPQEVREAANAFFRDKRTGLSVKFSLGPRSPELAAKEWEQACRQRWRALALVIKAKLEAVESGISVFEDEFMANIVLPGGRTVSEEVRPRIAAMYEGGPVQPLLPDYSG